MAPLLTWVQLSFQEGGGGEEEGEEEGEVVLAALESVPLRKGAMST